MNLFDTTVSPLAPPDFLDPTGDTLLQDRVSLSESIIWQLQRNYFEGLGIEAWLTSVPFYVTSNPFVGDQYARVVVRYLQDLRRNGDWVAEDPIYIVELGAGHGKFSHHFLSVFYPLMDRLGLADMDVRYVVTDLAERNLEWWAEHPQWQDWIQAGRIDFALYDMEATDADIVLHRSGDTLKPGCSRNPLVVVANYAFDSVKHDAFFAAGKKTYGAQVQTRTTAENFDAKAPDLTSLVLQVDHGEMLEKPFPEDEALNKVTRAYSEELEGRWYLIPTGGMICLRNLMRIASGKMFMISGDNGHTHMGGVAHEAPPRMSLHGSFSWMVNYEAMGRWMKALGGDAKFREFGKGLKMALFCSEGSFEALPEAACQFEATLMRFGPDDFLRAKREALKSPSTLSVDTIISFLRMSRFDPDYLIGLGEGVVSAAEPDNEQRLALLECLDKVEANIFHLPNRKDYYFEFARVFQILGVFERALNHYMRSVEFTGPEWAALFNIGTCLNALERYEEALDYFRRALDKDPSSDLTREWIANVETYMASVAGA